MTEIAPDLAAHATAELRRRGIEVHTGTTIERVSADSVELSTGEIVPTRMTVWTAGVKPHPVVAKLGLPLDGGGRIAVRPLLQGARPPGRLGDRRRRRGARSRATSPSRPRRPRSTCCARPRSPPTTSPPTLAGEPGRRRPFRYRTLGAFVDMGRNQAVASTLGIKWRGFPAWFLARTYHLALMPGNRRRGRLVADWTVGLLFGRDSAELGSSATRPRWRASEPPAPAELGGRAV